MNTEDTKAIIFDIDGVLINPPYFFNKELENNGYTNADIVLNSFFTSDTFIKCLEGYADIKNEIKPFLQKINWKESVDDYLKKNFEFETKYLNQEFIKFIQIIRKKDIKCYIGIDQEHSRANFLLHNLQFKRLFDGYYISCKINSRKCNNRFWQYTLKDISKKIPNIKPNDIVFFDDRQKNIDLAINNSIQAYLFNPEEDFKHNIEKIVNIK